MIKAILDIYGRNLDYAHRLVADLADEALCVQPAPRMNHAAWVLGHLARTSDRVAGVMLLGLEPHLPENLEERFDNKSIPVSSGTAYPDKETLVRNLDETHGRIAAALAEMPDTILADTTPHPRFAERFPLLGQALLHVLIGHEQVHLGQLSAWRRVQGLPAV